MDLLALELLLPFHVVLDLSSQSGSLALMVEIYPVDGVVVSIHSDEAIDTSPKAHTLHGVYGLLLSVNLALVVFLSFFLTLAFHHLFIFGGSSLVVEVAEVECVQYLLLCIKRHVGILRRLQHLRDEGEKERHDHHDDNGVDDSIAI